MSMTSESEEMIMPINGVDSPSIDDANSGGNVGGNGQLKKGPWTSAEDAILVEYVTKHGEGNWNAVQKHSGLARCGKSCRLRWANHLRPDLKKGAFSPEEERRIIELHAKMGNKWARMAVELPGRTDNEIKNYWNTRIKRRQRAGLPIYPPDICLQALNENQQTENINTFSSSEVLHPGFIPVTNFDVPDFKGFEPNQQIYSASLLDIPSSSLLDISPSSLLPQGIHSSYPNKSLTSTVHPPKRLRGSEPFICGLTNTIPGGIQYQNSGSSPIGQSFVYSSACDHNSTSDHATLSSIVLSGSHAGLNGNPSSEPNWAMKLELPSLQTHMGSWGSPSPSSPVHSPDSVDTLIQTPPTEHAQSCNLSPQNSGLLDAVLYGAQTMKNSKGNNGYNHMTGHSYLHEAEWEAYGEQLSPLGHSSSSVFSESTPNSLDERRFADTFQGYKIKEEANNLAPMHYDDKAETTNQMIFSRPDVLLASNCFGPMKDPTKDHSLLKGAIETYLGDELSRDCKQMDTGATSATQGHVRDSCTWNPMSTV
ncbi:hypothetical protein BUALT_Bualt13G0048100 [Buddleja alternifolia]|uniref:Transcription factor n=1 Tax=Buddleja alternifolia TaxID=168488 RepID=A0AAV6WLV0_9LAMI|nr:hypothetical protein BUALT_Bualt13G0048100 [Buddleja alternifolia]